MTPAEYKKHLKEGDFLEHAEVFGNYYGTLRQPIDDCLENGQNVLLDVDTKGALQVKEKIPEAMLIFIEPPSMEELEKRLRGRGTESEEVIKRRLKEAQVEMDKRHLFDFLVVNDNLEQAQKDLDSLMYP